MRAKKLIIKSNQKGVINHHASVNNTFLAPYYKYECTVIEYFGGRIDLLIEGDALFEHVEGTYTAENGWNYTIDMLITKN